MNIVGVKDLKNQLSQYLHRVKKGEEVIVTERGKPIAVIAPAEGSPVSRSLEARLTELAKEGKITLPRGKWLERLPRIPIQGGLLSQTVLENRR